MTENADDPVTVPTDGSTNTLPDVGIPPQDALLLDTMLQVSRLARRRRGHSVEIHPAEAQRLAEIPYELMWDIADIAIKRVVARDETHLQLTDLEAAYRSLITQHRPRPWATIASTVGGVFFGFGFPIICAPFVFQGTVLTSTGSALGFLFSVSGSVALSIGLVLSFRKNP